MDELQAIRACLNISDISNKRKIDIIEELLEDYKRHACALVIASLCASGPLSEQSASVTSAQAADVPSVVQCADDQSAFNPKRKLLLKIVVGKKPKVELI